MPSLATLVLSASVRNLTARRVKRFSVAMHYKHEEHMCGLSRVDHPLAHMMRAYEGAYTYTIPKPHLCNGRKWMSVRVDHGGNKCNVHHGGIPYAYTDYKPHVDERPCDQAKFELNEHPCRFGHHCGMGVVTGDKSKCECAPNKPFDFKFEHLRNAPDVRGAPHYGAKLVAGTSNSITTLAQGEESTSITTLAVGEESEVTALPVVLRRGISCAALSRSSGFRNAVGLVRHNTRDEEDPASGAGLTTLAVGEEAGSAVVTQMFAQNKSRCRK